MIGDRRIRLDRWLCDNGNYADLIMRSAIPILGLHVLHHVEQAISIPAVMVIGTLPVMLVARRGAHHAHTSRAGRYRTTITIPDDGVRPFPADKHKKNTNIEQSSATFVINLTDSPTERKECPGESVQKTRRSYPISAEITWDVIGYG